MELDVQSLFGLHVDSCTHWLTPTPPTLLPHLGSYTKALLVSQDRRHLFLTPWSQQYCPGKEFFAVPYRITVVYMHYACIFCLALYIDVQLLLVRRLPLLANWLSPETHFLNKKSFSHSYKIRTLCMYSFFLILKRDFFGFWKYFIQHCFFCRHSEMHGKVDEGPKIIRQHRNSGALFALFCIPCSFYAQDCSNDWISIQYARKHSARSHPK